MHSIISCVPINRILFLTSYTPLHHGPSIYHTFQNHTFQNHTFQNHTFQRSYLPHIPPTTAHCIKSHIPYPSAFHRTAPAHHAPHHLLFKHAPDGARGRWDHVVSALQSPLTRQGQTLPCRESFPVLFSPRRLLENSSIRSVASPVLLAIEISGTARYVTWSPPCSDPSRGKGKNFRTGRVFFLLFFPPGFLENSSILRTRSTVHT
ncbi:hypothetical protein METBIDRAFT_219861 [Metschnikowia bicuspidata var. bicuspidata NRRL YB-4993]|uniref:Uncharacterized protein n=1 Tax=Metschnikowia bicuspidata var. bicuspidata NRRL YB-4993 TaxID=869754 RepID=A0A1A0H5K3_9ASCO|nr:hypothetical protein METBIDRAFT_219861 [Metschnikowia bicuspidata var. bicuspidata NRRL YB-4993]OBA19177.1 hypothetical protein METBIDRAFT_219861 [Metschnikowia bicuspidata var. bicuspidata NRRL YB-4993]